MSLVERPDRRVLQVWRISSFIGYGTITLLLILFLGFLVYREKIDTPWLMLWLIPAAMLVLSQIVLHRQWSSWTFQVTPESLEMNHGWLWRQRRIVARDRIQHVDINSGPFDRRFGLVQVVVYTAGTTVGMIPGLTPERAQQLRDQLMAGRAVE